MLRAVSDRGRKQRFDRWTYPGMVRFQSVLLRMLILAMVSAPLHAAAAPRIDFLTQQKQYKRVRDAIQARGATLEKALAAKGLGSGMLNILFVAYKAEGTLELYAKKPDGTRFEKLAEYSICGASGQLGPKRKQGDLQIPEGFYRIDRYNPASIAWLSIGMNYPNAADKIKSRAANLGGDIFIHGTCISWGCLAIGDDAIKDVYLYAVYARASGQKDIPVYIFPFRMTGENMRKYAALYKERPELQPFWKNLKKGYDLFVADDRALTVRVDGNGDYLFGP
jgi:murein L,D-transpeptidase YafK